MADKVDRIYLDGVPKIEVRLRRSRRARRMSLRVSGLDGRVTLSAPPRLALAELRAFLEDRAGWVRRHLADRPADLCPVPGAMIPVEGRPRRISAVPRAAPHLEADTLSVAANRPAAPQVAALLKILARNRLAEACDRQSRTIGRPYRRLTLRDTRSRWGSCTSAGDLMFSWRLAMAPPDVLAYVAAHEIAHLREMNHSGAFWALVAGLCPDYARHRRWLRDHGAALHCVRFDP